MKYNIKRVYIEITNICNLNCSFCIKNTRQAKFMTINEFEYIINKIKDITPYIYLHVQGEPLLHPKFIEIINICNKYNMLVNLTTNGTLLTKYPNLYDNKSIRKISISMHSFNTINYDLLDYIYKFDNNLNDKQYLELRFWNKNKLSKTSKEYIDLLTKYFKFENTSKPNSYRLSKNIYIHFDDEFEWPTNAINNSNVGTCKGVKSMLCVLSNGDVTPCCLDQDCHIKLGNIYNTDIDKLLECNTYKNMITGFNNNTIIEPLCKQCTYRIKFEKSS